MRLEGHKKFMLTKLGGGGGQNRIEPNFPLFHNLNVLVMRILFLPLFV